MIDFIGIGAQKSGTSWAYACLYEHPDICAPIKEIHFFSRPRYEKGRVWYESHFKTCDPKKLKGEFSTSYLYAPEAAERIHALYPEVKIIAILRNPITRAYSQYQNAIKAGEIPETCTFDTYQTQEPSVIEQGMYDEQLARYRARFPSSQILVLVYEDIAKDPAFFMRRIYTFLGVDPVFTATMLHTQVNIARTPKHIILERIMHHIAEFLRKTGFHQLVWMVRKMGIPDLVRSVNTKAKAEPKELPYDYASLAALFREDAARLSAYIGRDMVTEWNLI